MNFLGSESYRHFDILIYRGEFPSTIDLVVESTYWGKISWRLLANEPLSDEGAIAYAEVQIDKWLAQWDNW